MFPSYISLRGGHGTVGSTETGKLIRGPLLCPAPCFASVARPTPVDRTGRFRARRVLAGSRPPPPGGVDPLPSRSNYSLGSDRAGWRTDVTHYGQVVYREL